MMIRCYNNVRKLSDIFIFKKRHITNWNGIITLSRPVEEAIQNRKSMVALESTVFTHGLPWPTNIETALELERIVSEEHSLPVTIGVLNNKIKAGFSNEELRELALSETFPVKPKKISRRDFYNIGNIKYGGTTVAGTIVVAQKLGIEVFATGGIGGVHKGSSETMDVSADLRELGRNSICVVCSGVKSFLDISKTLEYLETEGVFVCTFGSNDFPGFFVKSSGSKSPHRVDSIEEAAVIIDFMGKCDISSGMLLAVPIPDCFESDGILIQKSIDRSLLLAKTLNIRGSEVTPFVLQKVCELTRGKSLELNVELIKNNAMVGGKLAFYLNKLRKSIKTPSRPTRSLTMSVIGGSIVDNIQRFTDTSIRSPQNVMPQASYDCTNSQTSGGVGRNIADVLFQLGEQCIFLSATGKDLFADFLRQKSPLIDWSLVKSVEGLETSNCSVVTLSNNDIYFHVGNFEMAKHITPQYVGEHLEPIKQSLQLICMDCNVPIDTMQYVVKLAKENNVLVFLEPTDILLVHKVLKLLLLSKELSSPIDILSPNISEFMFFYNILKTEKEKYNFTTNDCTKKRGSTLHELRSIITNTNILDIIPQWIIKLGASGVVFASKEEFFFIKQSPFLITRRDIVNASGAGDCLATCALYLHFKLGLTWRESIAGGIRMSKESIENKQTVPTPINVTNYSKKAILSWTKNMYDSRLLTCIDYEV